MDDIPLKITVATVTFNAGEQLKRTIKSVESQIYPYVEHVIIDGNSQDDTMEEIHRYQERNSIAKVQHEIQALSEPDEGIYDAMNKAIQMSTGDYIIFINAGDTFHSPKTLSEMAKVAEKEDHKKCPAVVYGNTDIVDNEGHFVRKRRLSPPQKLTWRSFKHGMTVCHQAFLARTDLAKQTSYNMRYRFSADFDWCIRIMRLAKYNKLEMINSEIVVADYLEEGTTTKNHSASLRERFRIMVRHYGLVSTVFFHLGFVLRKLYKK